VSGANRGSEKGNVGTGNVGTEDRSQNHRQID
jgi:hypothetical protein